MSSSNSSTPEVLVGSGEYQVVGLRHYSGVANPGENVILIREPHHQYDPNAIRVDNIHGEIVGYIKGTMAKKLAPVMDGIQLGVRLEGAIPRRGDKYSLPLAVEFYSTDEGKARETAEYLRSALPDNIFQLAAEFSAAASSSANTGGALAVLVTPEKTRKRNFNWCEEKLRYHMCRCVEAKYKSQCQSCKLDIYIGDCVEVNLCGGTHKHCPIGREEDRGVPAIMAGYNNNVDYGRSFCNRIASDDTRRLLSITSGSNIEEDMKMPAAGSKRPAQVTQDDCEESDENSDTSDDLCDGSLHQISRKKAKCDGSISSDDLNEMLTDEQRAILHHKADPGEVVPVNALAGCGKTTLLSHLCNKFHNQSKSNKVLYLVFNSALEKEAKQSNKFPKERMEIRTTHSYVLRHYFGQTRMHTFEKDGDYKLDDIIRELDLKRSCRSLLKTTLPEGPKGEKVLERRVKTVAGYIRRTINRFQASDKRAVEEAHVPWLAKIYSTKRTKWRKEIRISKYIAWSTQVFDRVHQKCITIRDGRPEGSNVRITHDAYLKVAQLEQLHIPHDYVCIDEAQDMTACQSDLFWGHHQRSGKRMYLVGDRYQQIYRFRGASSAFREIVDASNHKFSLTGSFRFGSNIAAVATLVLQGLGGEVLHGRSNDQGSIQEVGDNDGQGTMGKGVVLCRTQNGILRYLHAYKSPRWCNLSGKCDIPVSPKKWESDLQSFLKRQADVGSGKDCSKEGEETPSVFVYKGEKFETISDIEEYIDDEGDIELSKALTLLKFLVSRDKPIESFYSDLRNSFHPMRKGETPDEYNGVVMTTVHKAKGLEFKCPVLISDDFRFKAINSAVVNRERHCDEANLLYVAITRATSKLYLTEEARQCLEKISELDHVKVQLPSMCSLDASRERLDRWREEWKSFKDVGDLIESIDDVPFPPEWDNDKYPLALHYEMAVSKQRSLLWQFLRVFHPDKFLPQFRKRIQSERVYAEVKIILEQITRTCTALLGALRDEGED